MYALGLVCEVSIRIRKCRFGFNKKSYASAKKKHENATKDIKYIYSSYFIVIHLRNCMHYFSLKLYIKYVKLRKINKELEKRNQRTLH